MKLVTLHYAMNIGPTAERYKDTAGDIPTYSTRPKGDETAKAHILNECADVFDGIGCFEGEYNITARLNYAASSALCMPCTSSTTRIPQRRSYLTLSSNR